MLLQVFCCIYWFYCFLILHTFYSYTSLLSSTLRNVKWLLLEFILVLLWFRFIKICIHPRSLFHTLPQNYFFSYQWHPFPIASAFFGSFCSWKSETHFPSFLVANNSATYSANAKHLTVIFENFLFNVSWHLCCWNASPSPRSSQNRDKLKFYCG